MTDKSYEILKLLKTNDGVKSLLHGGDLFGLKVYNTKEVNINITKQNNSSTLKSSQMTFYPPIDIILNSESEEEDHKIKEIDFNNQSIINFETISIDCIPYEIEIPLGYEEYEKENWKSPHKLERDVYLLFDKNENNNFINTNNSFIIKDVRFYPENSIGQPILSIYQKNKVKLENTNDEEFNEEDLIGLEINKGDIRQLGVKLIIPATHEGYLGRWIVLTFQSSSNLSLVASVNFTFNMAIRVTGCVTKNSLKDGIKNLVSADAKKFIPKDLLNYFDASVLLLNDYSIINCTPKDCYTIIENTKRLSSTHIIPENLKVDYDKFLKENKLNILADRIGYNDNNNKLLNDTSSVTSYLSKIGLLMYMEEIHMSRDISQYDFHNFKFNFFEDPIRNISSNQEILKLKFKVTGSSELRPHIALGDTIRLRPVFDEQIHTKVLEKYKIASPNTLIFEIVGKITKYNLANESCSCDFIKPMFTFFSNDTKSKQMKVEIASATLCCKILNELLFNCRFTFDNTGFVFIHTAINKIMFRKDLQDSLFPDSTSKNIQQVLIANYKESLNNISIENTNISDYNHNEEQLLSIKEISCLCAIMSSSILDSDKSFRLPPYIIYGPPGTGKTCTLISSILDIKSKFPSYRILCCAPSDAACDVIALRLTKYFPNSRLLRLNWWQRILASVPIALLRYCCQSNAFFEIPKDVMKYEIIVCTPASAGLLRSKYSVNSKSNIDDDGTFLYDVVIIDEASQATEAECYIPLSMCKKTGVMVLAGDPQQLNSQLRSPIHSICNTDISLQERLLKSNIYKNLFINEEIMIEKSLSKVNHSLIFDANSFLKNNQDPIINMGVFLTKNYRSHHTIIEIPSRLFYYNSLVECGDKKIINSLINMELLPKDKEFPLLFIGVDGQHYHELDSPSFYNINEIVKTVETIKLLLSNKELNISTKDIGIICAFRSQILKMRLAMRDEGFGSINIGSVEDFQGQESKIMIISTVLTNRIPSMERKGYIGLLGDHRRFNVAITRGMALVIVIGQPYLLHTDKNWRSLLEYCDLNDACIGLPCKLLKTHSSEDMEDTMLLDDIARLCILNSCNQNSNYNYNDSQWRVLL